ncbi:mannose-1-phosphate guanylyltransferase [uncultured Ilyobacter sp.]|uniref:mannose-1-phosphate guanylyltransferase n=1 Tax=uncultured Ilyobacter sp. TaxID=544433 RepID=UPI0029F4F69F|nr:mannose-1-phosphate guanylyltransferase [uncultured Ilyobacter sp.]
MLTALIMAGGSGERFWPLSTKERPKQLLKLVSDKSMIRETVDRILPMIPAERIFIGTNIIQAPAVKEELPFLPEENIIIEPAFKDTAAAIGYGATYIKEHLKENGELTMVVLASDHLIKNEDNFRKRMETAVNSAKKDGSIVTLGIKPTKPETGYGYIEVDGECYIGEPAVVRRFWEKPNEERAERYIDAGNYLWNSGMFIFEIKTILEAMEKHMPKHYAVLEDIGEIIGTNKIIEGNTQDQIKEKFEEFEKMSIDFGIMEKADNIKVIPVDFGWNDIGSFPALEDVFDKNENGTICKIANLIEINSKNNIVLGNGKRLIATVGINDTVVVETENSILVCHKDEAQNIKKILKELKI